MMYHKWYRQVAVFLLAVGFLSLLPIFLPLSVAEAEDTYVSNTSSVLPGKIELVTKGADGQAVYADHSFPSMAEDGSLVFVSDATNLVAPPTAKGEHRFYFYDNATKTISVLPSFGTNAAFPASITADKAWILLHAYLYNTSTGEFTTVAKADGTSLAAAAAEVTGDGSVVAITTLKKLVPEDTNTKYDLYLWHRAKKEVQFIPTTSSVNGIERDFALSDDGQFVAYVVRGSSSPACGSRADDIYRKNIATGEVICLTEGIDDSDGEYFNSPQMSADGSLFLVNGQVYVGVNPQLNAVYLVDVNGGTTTTLFTKSELSTMGSYRLTADGKFVQYMKLNSSMRQLAELCTYEVATATHSCITKPADIYGGYVHTISPTGRYSVIASWDHSWIGSTADNINPVNQGRPDDLFIWDREGVNNTISGKVTGDDGVTGLANVTLTNGSREKYLTDASGTYSMPYLNAGQTYEVTPTLFGKTFYPAKRLVTVPTSGSVDFSTKNQVTVVSSGFDPKVHGWGFRNTLYEISWQNFKDTYGVDRVEYGNGVPKLMAGAYYRDLFTHIKFLRSVTASCYGMVTTAALNFRQSIPNPPGFTGNLFTLPTPETYEEDGTVFWESMPLANYIVAYQGYQTGDEQITEEKAGRQRELSESLALIKQSIDGQLQNPYALNFRGGDENNNNTCVAHTVLPLAYSDQGNTTVLFVYDPNHPGETRQATMNATTGDWEYFEPMWGHLGNGKTCSERFQVRPHRAYAVSLSFNTHKPIPPWPLNFVTAANTQDSSIRLLSLSEEISATVQGSEVTSLIPQTVPGQLLSHPQRYIVDVGVPISVALTHMQSGKSSVTFFDPNAVIVIKGEAAQGTSESLDFAANTAEITLQSVAKRDVSIVTGNDSREFQTDLYAIDLTGGHKAQLAIGAEGAISITSTMNQSDLQVHFLEVSASKTAEFTVTLPTQQATDTHIVKPVWETNSAIVQVDEGSNGTIDKEVVVKPIEEVDTQRLFLPLVVR